MRHGGAVEAPVLLGEETHRIANRTGQKVTAFSRDLGDGIFRQVLSETGSASLLMVECGIYEDRPIDCRLFPVESSNKMTGGLSG